MLECEAGLLFDDRLNLGKVTVDVDLFFTKFRQDQPEVVAQLLSQ